MAEESMGKILCPTRGGEGSYRTQDAAIAMAKQSGDELVFLYVLDLDFLNKTERAVRPDVVAEQMKHLGEFLLSMAQERAHDQGVEARYVLREGDVRAEIKAAAVEETATMVVLGQAAEDDPACTFAPAGLLEFAQEIETETGIEARVVC
jgi:nucleotide-binding universal stress UspA family protein